MTTAADGTFTVVGVGSGTHAVGANGGSSGLNVEAGYYEQGESGNFTDNVNEATQLSANANHAGIVLKLPAGFTISGTITEHGSGHPLKAYIFVFDSSTGSSANATTNSQGKYSIIGLRPGNYLLSAQPIDGPTVHHRIGWYDKPAPDHYAATSSDATVVVVGP